MTRHPFGVAVLATGIGAFGLASLAYHVGLRMNLTNSIPPGLYRVVDRPLSRDAIVLACLTKGAADFARVRGYVPSGSCDDGSAPVGKRIAAMAGDTIDVEDRGVLVNGRLLSNSVPLERDSEGRSLPRFRVTGHVVPPEEVWLLSSHSARSYDSRYYGGVPMSRIVARIEPLLTRR